MITIHGFTVTDEQEAAAMSRMSLDSRFSVSDIRAALVAAGLKLYTYAAARQIIRRELDAGRVKLDPSLRHWNWVEKNECTGTEGADRCRDPSHCRNQ